MILGVGIDLCEIARIARAIASEAFVRRVYTPEERLHKGALNASDAVHLAGAFATKEAFAKATGIGLAKVGLQNVWVSHETSGKPLLRLGDSESLWKTLLHATGCERREALRFHLSISHDGGFAVAVVIVERVD